MVHQSNPNQATTPTAAPGGPWAPEAWLYQPAKPLPGTRPGALSGLRFAVKDNIDVASWPTTAACPAFAYTASAHATVVQKLLDDGALLQGKTNLDQFACGLNGTRSPYGAVPNASNPLHVSGGSSSGSAYVVGPPARSTSRSAPTPLARAVCRPA